MFDAVRATSFVSTIYFMSLITFGNFILCNLFIAILLDAFAERAKEKEMEELRQKQEELMAMDKGPEATARFQKFRQNLSADYRSQCFEHWAEMMLLGRKDRLRREAARLKREQLALQAGLSRPPSPGDDSVEAMAAAAEALREQEEREARELAEAAAEGSLCSENLDARHSSSRPHSPQTAPDATPRQHDHFLVSRSRRIVSPQLVANATRAPSSG